MLRQPHDRPLTLFLDFEGDYADVVEATGMSWVILWLGLCGFLLGIPYHCSPYANVILFDQFTGILINILTGRLCCYDEPVSAIFRSQSLCFEFERGYCMYRVRVHTRIKVPV